MNTALAEQFLEHQRSEIIKASDVKREAGRQSFFSSSISEVRTPTISSPLHHAAGEVKVVGRNTFEGLKKSQAAVRKQKKEDSWGCVGFITLATNQS